MTSKKYFASTLFLSSKLLDAIKNTTFYRQISVHVVGKEIFSFFTFQSVMKGKKSQIILVVFFYLNLKQAINF